MLLGQFDQINLPYLLKTFKQTITCASKNLISARSNAENAKTLRMLQPNRSDRQNKRYVTELESTVEPYKTRPPMQYRSTLIRRDTNSQTSNLFPLELINSKRESIHRAHEHKAKTLQPCGISREDD